MNAHCWYLSLPKLGKIRDFDVHLKISFVILHPTKHKINCPEIHIWAGPASCLGFFLMLVEYILCFSGIWSFGSPGYLYDHPCKSCLRGDSSPCASTVYVELWHLCRAYSECLTGLLCAARLIQNVYNGKESSLSCLCITIFHSNSWGKMDWLESRWGGKNAKLLITPLSLPFTQSVHKACP